MHTYQSLQNRLDEVVGKLGLQRTVALLDSFINKLSVAPKQTEKVKLITHYLKITAVKCFDLKEEDFLTSNIKEYREARMICYHLLKKYCDFSYAKIAEVFGQSERTVLYFYHKAEELLSLPQHYKSLAQRHATIEDQLIEFIGKLE